MGEYCREYTDVVDFSELIPFSELETDEVFTDLIELILEPIDFFPTLGAVKFISDPESSSLDGHERFVIMCATTGLPRRVEDCSSEKKWIWKADWCYFLFEKIISFITEDPIDEESLEVAKSMLFSCDFSVDSWEPELERFEGLWKTKLLGKSIVSTFDRRFSANFCRMIDLKSRLSASVQSLGGQERELALEVIGFMEDIRDEYSFPEETVSLATKRCWKVIRFSERN